MGLGSWCKEIFVDHSQGPAGVGWRASFVEDHHPTYQHSVLFPVCHYLSCSNLHAGVLRCFCV